MPYCSVCARQEFEDRTLAETDDEYFIITEEIESDERYYNSDDEFDIYIWIKLTKYAEEGHDPVIESSYSTDDGIIVPHILDYGKLALYYNDDGKPWSLENGQKITFDVNIDTEYFVGSAGDLCFEALKQGESFSDSDLGESHDVITNGTFEYITEDSGEYRFYLYRSAKDPILVKWISVFS